MIPGRLSSRREFTPVPSCGSVFVYMIPKQNVMPARVIPVRVHPGSCAKLLPLMYPSESHFRDTCRFSMEHMTNPCPSSPCKNNTHVLLFC